MRAISAPSSFAVLSIAASDFVSVLRGITAALTLPVGESTKEATGAMSYTVAFAST